MTTRAQTATVALAALLIAVAASVSAQTYPVKPIRMIVGLAPGGGTDLTARIVSQKVAEQMGATIIVENRPGAGSVIGTDAVAKATPDGYTLLTASPEFSINPSLLKSLPYSPFKDFTARAGRHASRDHCAPQCGGRKSGPQPAAQRKVCCVGDGARGQLARRMLGVRTVRDPEMGKSSEGLGRAGGLKSARGSALTVKAPRALSAYR